MYTYFWLACPLKHITRNCAAVPFFLSSLHKGTVIRTLKVIDCEKIWWKWNAIKGGKWFPIKGTFNSRPYQFELQVKRTPDVFMISLVCSCLRCTRLVNSLGWTKKPARARDSRKNTSLLGQEQQKSFSLQEHSVVRIKLNRLTKPF